VLARLGGADRVAHKLEASGSPGRAAEIVGERWIAAACGAALGLVSPAPALSVPLGTIGFLAPEWSLSRGIRVRRSQAARELPLLLDVVAAAAGAGLTGQLAVRRATSAVRGPLADALDEAFRRVDLGGRWGDELFGAADRLALPDLHRAVAVLTRGDTVGSPLADALSEIAREARDTRRDLVAERARTAPVKMLFPLVFLVLPAFLLLTVVPVLVTTIRSIG
jgi:tight adherence protein C